MQNGGLRRAAADQFGPDPLAANPPYGLVIPDFRYSGKSGIHNHRSAKAIPFSPRARRRLG
jgi:hypothetical protein